ncbi:hypothetical protein Tco_1183419 [Tanacetum coccineum]
MKKFPEIPQRIEKDYHSIKDDISLVSVYTTRDVRVRGMLIPDKFLTEEIRATDEFKEYETMTPTLTASPQGKKRKHSAGESSSPQKSLRITIRQQKVVERDHDNDDPKDRLDPGSHKDNPKHVDDDDDKDDEKVEKEEGGEMGSLETKTEETQTTIPTPSRSPRTILSSDKNITQELTDTVPLPTTTTSQTSHSKCGISSKYSHLPEFNAQAPKIIEELFKNYVQSNVIQVHPTITTSTETTSSADIQQQLYFKMKRSLQDQANDPALWEVLKHKFEKSSISKTSCSDDDIHSYRDDHQEDDAPPEGEKRVKRHKASKRSKSARSSSSKHSTKDSTTYVSKQQQQQEWDTWVEETVIDEDEVILEDETLELITELQNVDKRVPTIYDYEIMRATLNDALSNQFKNAEEITIDQPHGLDFQILMMRENDKPDSFSEADFKYLNKNDIEDLYYLAETRSYQINVNLTALTLTFPGIEAREPYSIVDKPNTCLIYLNNKGEKRLIFLVDIVKFCDATLEKVLNEVKLKIFQSEPWKKSPLLGELDRDIMRALEREITKRLNPLEQMRRWESFVNGRPILPTMKRL